MKKLAILFFAFVSAGVLAHDDTALEHSDIQPSNLVSLQNGAKLYVNYCLGCHSLDHQRYERLARDLDLSDDIVMKNLMFTGEKIGDQMKIAMRKEDAAKWLGIAPPDLTLVARSRGPDWIYTYLKSFYKDEKRPYGVNNTVFPNVGMPHVLQGLQGLQNAVFEDEACPDDSSKKCKVFEKFEASDDQGSMKADEYDQSVRDITNFLNYVGEPIKQERKQIGIYVIMFLMVFFAIAYLLKKEYWKDVYPDGH